MAEVLTQSTLGVAPGRFLSAVGADDRAQDQERAIELFLAHLINASPAPPSASEALRSLGRELYAGHDWLREWLPPPRLGPIYLRVREALAGVGKLHTDQIFDTLIRQRVLQYQQQNTIASVELDSGLQIGGLITRVEGSKSVTRLEMAPPCQFALDGQELEWADFSLAEPPVMIISEALKNSREPNQELFMWNLAEKGWALKHPVQLETESELSVEGVLESVGDDGHQRVLFLHLSRVRVNDPDELILTSPSLILVLASELEDAWAGAPDPRAWIRR